MTFRKPSPGLVVHVQDNAEVRAALMVYVCQRANTKGTHEGDYRVDLRVLGLYGVFDEGLRNARFSETPTHGCWTWPSWLPEQ